MNPPIPDRLQKTHLKVLAWTSHFFSRDYLEPVHVENPSGPDIFLEFFTDRNLLAEADAVWFHAPSIIDMPSLAVKRQPWVLMSMESDVNYPALNNPVTRIVFDVSMTYRLDADVPVIYPNRRAYQGFTQPAPHRPGPSAEAPVAYIASNPVPYRDEYASELMKHLPVDSLGKCLHNRDIEDFVIGDWESGAWASIMKTLPNYKFYLAFENSQTTDYVTERVFHGLAAGAVPVYLGAPNVLDFMPSDEAVILASNFESPKDLAAFIRELDHDDQAYGRYHNWRLTRHSDRFNSILDLGDSEPNKRLAVKLAHGCDRSCCCGGRMREPGLMP